MNEGKHQELALAGFARLDITPPLGTGIGGYFTARQVKGVLDPLYVRAAALSYGRRTVVMLVCDLLSLCGEPGGQWPDRLARELGLEEGSVFLICTHTHTSPLVGSDREGNDPEYDTWFYRRLRDAATLALDDRSEVTDVRWVQGEAPGLAYVRRYYMKDGSVVTNPKNESPDLDRPTNGGDDTFRLVRILRREGREIALVNFQNHPDNIGGELISADFPGALCDAVEAGREVHCLYLNGAQGDLNAINRFVPKVPASHAKAVKMGRELAQAVLARFDDAVSTGVTGIGYARGSVALKTKRDPARVPEAQRIVELFRAGRTQEIHPTLKMANYIYSEAGHLCRLEREGLDYVQATVNALNFCGLALVGIPGEPFNQMGHFIRGKSAFPVTFVCCLVNGALGYFPLEQDYELGGYESYNSPLVKGTSEQLMELGVQLLESM